MADPAARGIGFVGADDAVVALFFFDGAHGHVGTEFDGAGRLRCRGDDLGGAQAALKLADAVIELLEFALGVG